MKLPNWLKKLFNIKEKTPIATEPQKTSEVPLPTTPSVVIHPCWYLKALNEIGVREVSGNAANPRIREYHSSTDLKATSDEVAWCAAFVNWCLKECGKLGTQKANARSFLTWGTEVKENPMKGDVVVFWRGKKDGWEGHVAFYVDQDDKYINVLGGNQGNEVNFTKYKKSQLLGIRRLSA